MKTAELSIDGYQDFVDTTCSPTTPELLDRLTARPDVLEMILRTAVHVGKACEQSKKYIYYGKHVDPARETLAQVGDPIPRMIDLGMVDVIHGLLGIIDEAGELALAMHKHIFGGEPLDVANVGEELGDTSWYVNKAATGIRKRMSEILERNKAKLQTRYKSGKFSANEAVNRNLVEERKVLEGGQEIRDGVRTNGSEHGSDSVDAV